MKRGKEGSFAPTVFKKSAPTGLAGPQVSAKDPALAKDNPSHVLCLQALLPANAVLC